MLEKITFPEHEYESVQNWLNKQGYCYTTRVYKEVGKYKIYDRFPEIANQLFDKTLEKRRLTVMRVEELFN